MWCMMIIELFNLCVSEKKEKQTFHFQLLVSVDVMPAGKYPEIIKGISTTDVQTAAKDLAMI